MTKTTSFTIARKGYKCSEVDAYIDSVVAGEEDLRSRFSALQEQYDKLNLEHTELNRRFNKVNSDCATLAAAVAKERERTKGASSPEMAEELTTLREKYEHALARIDELQSAQDANGSAEAESLRKKCEELTAENEKLKSRAVTVTGGDAASSIVAEVTGVVERIEKDARRKAEALTLSAKMEQARSHLIRERVNDEISGLIEMLKGFLEKQENEPKNTDTEENAD